MQYEEWLDSPEYERVSEKLTSEEKLRNVVYINHIPKIKADHMRVNKRNR